MLLQCRIQDEDSLFVGAKANAEGCVWLNLGEGLKTYEFRSGIDGEGQGCFLVSIREGDGGVSDRDDGCWEGEGFGHFLVGGRILRNWRRVGFGLGGRWWRGGTATGR